MSIKTIALLQQRPWKSITVAGVFEEEPSLSATPYFLAIYVSDDLASSAFPSLLCIFSGVLRSKIRVLHGVRLEALLKTV